MRETSKRAILFERDDTTVHDLGYLCDPKQVQLLPGAGEALCELQLERESMRQSLADRGRKWVGKSSWDTAARKLGQVYQSLV